MKLKTSPRKKNSQQSGLYGQLGNLKRTVGGWVDQMLPRAAVTPMVHPWLLLPHPAWCLRLLFPCNCCRKRGYGGDEDEEESEDNTKLHHFCFFLGGYLWWGVMVTWEMVGLNKERFLFQMMMTSLCLEFTWESFRLPLHFPKKRDELLWFLAGDGWLVVAYIIHDSTSRTWPAKLEFN